jgi:DNA-binding MarR family transcriptional regulator
MTAIEPEKAQEATTPDLYFLFRLLGTAHAVTGLVDAALREHGLSAATLRLLTALVTAPEPLGPDELQAGTIGSDADVGPLLDGLERDGLIRRTRQATNGRRVRLVVTARGRARQHAAVSEVEALGSQLGEALGGEGVDPAAVGRALSALR